MKCKVTILYCLFIICGTVLNAQTFIETAPSGSTRDGSLIVYGMDGKTQKFLMNALLEARSGILNGSSAHWNLPMGNRREGFL
jgi:hypothetical protein